MSCPICGHKMKIAGDVQGAQLLWCPHCGTLSSPEVIAIDVPQLAKRLYDYSDRPDADEPPDEDATPIESNS